MSFKKRHQRRTLANLQSRVSMLKVKTTTFLGPNHLHVLLSAKKSLEVLTCDKILDNFSKIPLMLSLIHI